REGELPLHASDRIRAEPTGRTQELDERTRRYDVDVADAKRVREEPADEADRLGDRDVHEPVRERRRDRVPLLRELRQRRSPVASADVEMFDAGMPAAAEAPLDAAAVVVDADDEHSSRHDDHVVDSAPAVQNRRALAP